MDRPARYEISIAENKPYAHHKTYLHTMKVTMILIPCFHGHTGSKYAPLFTTDRQTKLCCHGKFLLQWLGPAGYW